MNFNQDIINLIENAEKKLSTYFKKLDEIALFNQNKVLDAFRNNNIASRHMCGTTGYGYDDIGRDTLCKLYSDIFHTEACVVSPLIVSGTHALTLALFAALRPNDTMLSITGAPYDTLRTVIGGENIGSLKDFGISYEQIDLINSKFDFDAIKNALENKTYKLIFIGRSRGYEWRDALSVKQIGEVIGLIRKIQPNTIIMVDNCYGEFMDILEPSDVGADMMVGSLIKNPGGGLAPTGGYIAGKKDIIDQVAYRLTAPSIGMEVGSYISGYVPYYQGIFLAPHTVINAVKGSALMGQVFKDLGYEVMPEPEAPCNDIIRSIKFNTADELIKFIQSIQKASPIDSNVVPYPWAMPGYENEVIMAAGTFTQGASIELSADSPIKEPYIAYVQGGLTYEHVKIATMMCAEEVIKANSLTK